MQAVIMAGGKGTRLAAITQDRIPKPLAPIAGKPVLEWQIQCLVDNGINEIIVIIGHLGEKIKQRLGDGQLLGCHISYIEEKSPLGTAGAFYFLKRFLKRGPFLLVFGDVLFNIDIQRMIDFHQTKNAAATLFVHPNSHPYDSDLIECNFEKRVTAIHAKNQIRKGWYDNCVNAGLYVLDSAVCGRVYQPSKMDLEKDILSPMIERKEAVYAYRSPEYIKDIGTAERICEAERDIHNGLVAQKCLKKEQRCIFLDRDGTLNQYRGLIYAPSVLELEKRAAAAVKKINESGYLAVVVSNQPVVARGLCQPEDVETIHHKLTTLLGKEGSYLDDIFYCPHHPDKGYPEENPAYKISCTCRKPDIGMLKAAVDRYHIKLSDSWIIGDTTTDIQTGKNAGLKTALVLTGEGGRDKKFHAEPDLICSDILEAVNQILEEKL